MTTTTLTIPLETGWLVDDHDGEPTPTALSAWRGDGREARLTRTFTLAPIDFCVSYLLLVDRVPAGTLAAVNGQSVGEIGDKARVDVTDIVALGGNTLTFRVEPGASGAFSGVRLQAIPCE